MIKDWHCIEGLLDKSLCDKIIKDVKQNNELFEASVNNGLAGLNEHIRRSSVAFIPDQDPYQYIFDIFWRNAIRTNDAFFQFHLSRLECIQFSEYDEKNKGEYKTHHDVNWLGEGNYHRKLSIVVQLSNPNDYTGGDLQLEVQSKPKPHHLKMRQQGNMILFPSFIEHRVLPVTKGTRYSLVAWIEGRKWS